jgi:hypothetical protein
MRLVALKTLSPYLSMHMKNIKIRGHMCLVRQFEGNVILNSKLETNMGINKRE